MKKFIVFIFAILISVSQLTFHSFAVGLSDYDYSIFTPEQKVYSIGNYISDAQLKKYNTLLLKLEEQTHVNVSFIITNDFEGDAEEFSDSIFGYSPLGESYNSNIILLVVDMKGRVVDLYTHGEGQKMVSDSDVDHILDDIALPLLKSENYDKLLSKYYSKCNALLLYDGRDVSQIALYAALVALIAGAVITLIAVLFHVSRHKNIISSYNASNYNYRKPIRLSCKTDNLVNTVTHRTMIPKDTNSGGNGGGGGSGGSSHSHSSGRSHGGGSRSF